MAAKPKKKAKSRATQKADQSGPKANIPTISDAHKRMVDILLSHSDPTQVKAKVDAYTAIHPSAGKRTAYGNCLKILQRPEVHEHLLQRVSERMQRLEVVDPDLAYSQDDVIRWLQELRKRAMEPHEVRGSDGDVIPGVWRWDNRAALETIRLLMVHIGMPTGDRSSLIKPSDTEPPLPSEGMDFARIRQQRERAASGIVLAGEAKRLDS
jgi:hypothetical protein